MDDTDISGLSLEEARDYVLSFITSLKQTARQREQVAQEIESWRARLKLSQEKGAADLAARASTLLGQLEEKRASLLAEEQELGEKVDRLKRNLKRLEMTGGRLVDTDLLQAELDMAVGEEKAAEIQTDRALKDAQAQAALDEMKRKLQGDGSS
jgi:phage shock protein A